MSFEPKRPKSSYSNLTGAHFSQTPCTNTSGHVRLKKRDGPEDPTRHVLSLFCSILGKPSRTNKKWKEDVPKKNVRKILPHAIFLSTPRCGSGTKVPLGDTSSSTPLRPRISPPPQPRPPSPGALHEEPGGSGEKGTGGWGGKSCGLSKGPAIRLGGGGGAVKRALGARATSGGSRSLKLKKDGNIVKMCNSTCIIHSLFRFKCDM